LAKVLEVHQTEISQWIAGRRDVPKSKKGKLARMLKCKMSELYGD
jgi:DNA-binding transcriptional regulator YdaS (Cro superfamily)